MAILLLIRFHAVGQENIKPLAPSNLMLTSISETEVSLNWVDNSSDETNFKVYRSVRSEFDRDTLVSIVDANTTSYIASGLVKNTVYYFKVVSMNNSGKASSNVQALNLTCPPDLQFKDIIAEHSTISINEELPFKATSKIINASSCASFADNVNYKVFISSDEILDAEDINISIPENGIDKKKGLKNLENELLKTPFVGLDPVKIPNNMALLGQRYLIFQLDPENHVYEGSETNNLAVVPIFITKNAGLKIENFVIVNTNKENGTVTVNFDVVNTGEGALGEYYIEYLADNYLNGKILIATDEEDGLILGQRKSISKTLPISCVNYGANSLFVEVNSKSYYGSTAIKLNDISNTIASDQFSLVGEKPDLQMLLKIKNVKTVDAGQDFTVESTVFNTGGGFNGTNVITYYLSADGNIDANDQVLGSSSFTAGLSCSVTTVFNSTLTVPSSLNLGTYRVIAKVDGTSQLDEINEENNLASDVLVVSKDPDLVLQNFSISNLSPAAYESTTINFVVKNQGQGPVSVIYLDVFVSNDDNFSPSTDARLFSGTNSNQQFVKIPALASGEVYSGSVSLDFSTCGVEGQKFLFAKIDGYYPDFGDNTIIETNETNNYNSSGIKVNIQSNPDLQVIAPSEKLTTTTNKFKTNIGIKNNGSSAKINSQLKFYLSDDRQLDPSDKLLKTITINAESLPCEATHSISGTEIILPESSTLGSYTVLVVADADKNILEQSENNNLNFFEVERIVNSNAGPITPTPEPYTITTGALAVTSIRTGISFAVPYTKTGAYERYVNEFRVELSDAQGSFLNPVVIGAYAVRNPIHARVPAGTPSGTGYRVRVVSTSPYIIGTESQPFTVVGVESNTITTGVLASSVQRVGISFAVPYTKTGTYERYVNEFQVELSDASGSFSNAVIIGAYATRNPIYARIPANIPSGNGYKVRVVSTSPKVIGTESQPFTVIGQTFAAASIDEEENPIKIAGTTISNEFKLSVHPNPVILGTEVMVSLGDAVEGAYSVNVFDLTGKNIHTGRLTHTGGVLQSSVPTSGLKPGLYLVRISSGDLSFQARLLVQ